MLGNGLQKQGDPVSKANLGFIVEDGLWKVECFEDTGGEGPGLAFMLRVSKNDLCSSSEIDSACAVGGNVD